jgi:hypothetical protein
MEHVRLVRKKFHGSQCLKGMRSCPAPCKAALSYSQTPLRETGRTILDRGCRDALCGGVKRRETGRVKIRISEKNKT